MKNLTRKLVIFSLAVALIGFTAFNASAIPFSGDISFSGDIIPTDIGGIPDYNLATAAKLVFPSVANITAVDGQYAGVPVSPSISSPGVTRATITYNPATFPINPLWNFSYLGVEYSFTATSMTVADQTVHSLKLTGVGTGHIDGFDDTPGTWIVTANTSGTTASFSASTGVTPVPEPTSALLIGFGLVGLAGVRRKFAEK